MLDHGIDRRTDGQLVVMIKNLMREGWHRVENMVPLPDGRVC